MASSVSHEQVVRFLADARKGHKAEVIRATRSLDELFEVLDARGWTQTRALADRFIAAGGDLERASQTPAQHREPEHDPAVVRLAHDVAEVGKALAAQQAMNKSVFERLDALESLIGEELGVEEAGTDDETNA